MKRLVFIIRTGTCRLKVKIADASRLANEMQNMLSQKQYLFMYSHKNDIRV